MEEVGDTPEERNEDYYDKGSAGEGGRRREKSRGGRRRDPESRRGMESTGKAVSTSGEGIQTCNG